jgi:hypothetical protein
MIELKNDTLCISFPQAHPDAKLRIDFQRTLRIPDDAGTYPLPPGLGRFPLRHVDDFKGRIPEQWVTQGGVMLPMYQAEAMWLNFSSPGGYPFAVRVATGKIDAVTGDGWVDGLRRAPQNYLSIPEQPWLDGYCVEKGVIRQFVAMPLGAGYTVEEQLTGKAEHGGLQLAVYPLKAEVWRRMQRRRVELEGSIVAEACYAFRETAMGLAPGGRMRQEIYEDQFQLSDWDLSQQSRCFVHIANSMLWRQITEENPPTVPPTAEAYTRARLPWFEWYNEAPAVSGSEKLDRAKSVSQLGKAKGQQPLPENTSVDPSWIVPLRPEKQRDVVREGIF